MKKFAKFIPWICLAVVLAVVAVVLCTCNRDPGSQTPGNVEGGSCTVAFDLNGTQPKTTTVQPQTVAAGALLREPEVFVIGENPDNWSIKGWFMEPECENEWDFDIDIVEQDMTLYARWVDDPQRTVTYFAGRDTQSLQQVHTAQVSLGLNAEKCDDRVQGYEVLGYYADENFQTAFDFDTPIDRDINIYIKTSDYVYLSPKYLSTFGMANVTHNLAMDGSDIALDYKATRNDLGMYSGDNYVFTKGVNLVLNGYDHLEMVYKLENGHRVDLLWFGVQANGASVKGYNDFTGELMNVGLKEFGTTIWTDSEGWTHAVYDLTRVARYYQVEAPRIVDIAALNGLRIDVDGESAETAKLTIKYIKGSHGPAGSNITYYVGGAVKADEFVPAGETPKGYPELGRRVYYYSDKACTKPYNITKAPKSDIDLYLKIDTTHIHFDGVQLNNFIPMAGAQISVNGSGNLSFSGRNGAFIHHKELGLDLKGDNTLEIKAKLDGCIPGMFIFGRYTVNGKAGVSTDYGQKYTNVTSVGQVTDGGDGWSIITVDLTKIAPGFQMKTIEGLRLDIYGQSKYDLEVEYVRSYRANKHTVTMNVDGELYMESVNDGCLLAGGALLGRNLAYYTDKEMTQPFDPLTPITKDITLYVKILDHLYFDGPGLALFTPQAGADTYANLNGELVMCGSNGAFIHKKELGLPLNGDNTLEIRANLNGATPGIYLFGEYTLGGEAGESTDYGQDHTRVPEEAITSSTSGHWTTLTVDLNKIAPGFQLEVLNGLRFDLYGNENYTVVIDYIKSYEVLKHTVTMINGEEKFVYIVEDGTKITSVGPLGRKVEYFSDEACTAAYDVSIPVTSDVTVYVKLGQHIYFDGVSLNQFIKVGEPAPIVSVNRDNSLTVTGVNGTFLHKKDLNLAMNGDNMLDIKLKMSSGSAYGIFIYGQYAVNGEAGESTDYGQDYTKIPEEAITAKADGAWTVLTIDFSKVAEGYELLTMNGLRLDIYGNGSSAHTHTYGTVTSYYVEKYTVTYLGDVTKTESVEKGQPISGGAILGRKVEYFTDEACTVPFDVITPITEDTTVYVKLGKHIYFDGVSLNSFNKVGEPAPTVVVNKDNSLTVTGQNGTFLHKKGLNLAMNGDNALDIKLKMSAGSGYSIYIFGQYTVNGEAGESTDYGQDYTKIPDTAITARADGDWTLLSIDLTQIAEGYQLLTMNGFRLDINGNGTLTHTYHSVQSYVSEKCTVTYKGDVNRTEMVEKGRTAGGNDILGRQVEYFADEACTVAYDLATPVTADTTVYVKISRHIYFDGAALNSFNKVGSQAPTVLMNDDGTLTVMGQNGTFLHKKGLGLDMNGDNMLDIKLKMTAGSGYGIFIYGKYTLGGVAGESTDYGQAYTRIPEDAIKAKAEGNWTVLTIDLTKVAEGYELLTMNGLRLDIYGNGTLTHTYHSVRSYLSEKCTVTYKGDVTKTELVEKGQPISGDAILGRKVEYFTDEACTVAYNVAAPVTGDTTIYVKVSRHIYFDGAALNSFNKVGSPAPTVILNSDGSLTVMGQNGTFLHKKNLNLAMNGDNCLDIKLKMTAGSGYGIFIYGQYEVNGVAGESTDYGQAYTRIPDGAVTASTEDGWTVLTVDFTKVAEGYELLTMNGLRLDIYGSGTLTHTYHSVESYQFAEYTVTYKGDIEKTEKVLGGKTISGDAVLGRKVEYFTNAACTAAFDPKTPITADTTLYVKIGQHIYFDGAALESFNKVGSPAPTTILNSDGSLTVMGSNGTFLHKKALNLAMNGDNRLDIKLKMSAGSGYSIFIYGKYTLGGVAGESTDYGQSYTRIPAAAITTGTQGEWSVLTVDFGKVADGYVMDTINGLRLDIYGNGTLTHTYHSVTSYRSSQHTVTYKGDVEGTEQVTDGKTIQGSQTLGYETLYFTDAACTQAFDPATPITGNKTLYVKMSDYLYLSGADIRENFATAAAGTVNDQGQLVFRATEGSAVFNWRPTYENVAAKKFEIRFHLENHGDQVAFFTQGKLSNGATLGETGVYHAINADGWHTLVFDFDSKLTGNNQGALIDTLNQFRFDVYGCTENTVITIDYIKSIPEKTVYTVTYAGAITGTETVEKDAAAQGAKVPVGREVLYFADEACTQAYSLATPVTGDVTVYTKLSRHVSLSGEDIKSSFNVAAGNAAGTLNTEGQFTIAPAESTLILNWRPTLEDVSIQKFEVRFKLENHGSQVALFTQGTLSNGATLGEIGVYYATSQDGWYTVTFDFGTKLTGANAGAVLNVLKQIRFDVNGCTEGTVLTIDYIKSVD